MGRLADASKLHPPQLYACDAVGLIRPAGWMATNS
jgi:hypothetical protein